jgi:cation diffusion facilitator family transporter
MKRTEKAELVAVMCSIFMAAGMLIVAAMTHSISILAEGTDTVIDVVASIAVLAGLRLAARKTRTFPSGLYKLENVIATGIGILILFSAYELARESIERILSGKSELDGPWLVISVMAVVVAITGFIAWYKGKVGKEENSPSLRADAKHSWTDLIASVAIIVGVGLEIAGVKNMDSVAALVVVAFLAWSGVEVTLGGVRVLLDASIEKEILEKARGIAEADPRVRKVLDVEGRNSGSYRFLEVSLVPWDYDLREAERLYGDLRAETRRQIENVDEVLVDIGVDEGDRLVCGLALEPGGGAVAASLAGAALLEIVQVSVPGGDIITRESVEPPVPPGTPGRGARLAVMLARRGVEVVLTGELEPEAPACSVLDANGVKVLSRPGLASVAEAELALRDVARSYQSAGA